MTSRLLTGAWVLNPALRFYDVGDVQKVVELDDRHGRTMRMSISADAIKLLERFRPGLSWSTLRDELVAAGVEASRLAAMEQFLAGPCRDRRLLVEPDESTVAKEQPAKPAYVSGLLDVIPWRLVNRISVLLQWLFSPSALMLGGVVVAVSAGALFSAMHATHALRPLGALQVLAVIGMSAFGVLLHELGHAAAAYRLGARRVSIGIGWYVAIPVAYSNLSELWRYPRQKRLVVNLAGVYMQGLLIAALMMMFHATRNPAWLVAAGATAMSILWNLNPLLRMDGYWIAADALGIPDLRARSAKVLHQVMRRIFLRERGDADRMSVALAVYGLLSSIFLGALLIRAAAFLLDAVAISLPEFLRRAAAWRLERLDIAEWMLVALAVAWNALFFYAALRLVWSVPARLLAWWRRNRQPR